MTKICLCLQSLTNFITCLLLYVVIWCCVCNVKQSCTLAAIILINIFDFFFFYSKITYYMVRSVQKKSNDTYLNRCS